MILSRRLRSLLAGSRHGVTALVAGVLLVLAAVGVHTMCSAHQHEQKGGAAQAHGGHGHGGESPRSDGEALAAHDVMTDQVDVAEPGVGGSSGCSDHDTVTVQSDQLLLSSPVLVTTPERTAIRLAPAVAHQDYRSASGVAATATPSLRALGISRT